MKMYLKLTGVLLMLVLAGCAGKEGPMGPSGLPGAKGSGYVLAKVYTGTIPSAGSYTLNVPEIKDKQGKTYVSAYWAYSDSPDVWTPMADGWLDSETYARVFKVSWSLGQVAFAFMKGEELYRAEVYEYHQ